MLSNDYTNFTYSQNKLTICDSYRAYSVHYKCLVYMCVCVCVIIHVYRYFDCCYIDHKSQIDVPFYGQFHILLSFPVQFKSIIPNGN